VRKHRRPDAPKHPLARLDELRRLLAGATNVSAVYLLVTDAAGPGLPALRLYGGPLRLRLHRGA
jgi:hypothetical protein